MTAADNLTDDEWFAGIDRITRTPTVLTDRAYTRNQLADLPVPSPLIDGTLDRRTVAAIAGPPGTLKSFILLGWACSVATGTPWLGRHTEQGRVLIVAAEGAHGMHQRIAAWEDKHQHDVPDNALTVIAGPVNLTDLNQTAELCDLTGGHAFVGIDTLARCAVGADENSARDMGLLIDACYRIRDHTGDGTVALVHHTPKGNGATMRGSSALEGGLDTIYHTEGDPAGVTLTRTKRKDGPTDDLLTLALNLRKGSGVAVGISGGQNAAEDHLLAVFTATFPFTGCSKTELRHASEQPTSTFYRALGALISRGLLRNDGTDKRPFYRLGGVPGA